MQEQCRVHNIRLISRNSKKMQMGTHELPHTQWHGHELLTAQTSYYIIQTKHGKRFKDGDHDGLLVVEVATIIFFKKMGNRTPTGKCMPTEQARAPIFESPPVTVQQVNATCYGVKKVGLELHHVAQKKEKQRNPIQDTSHVSWCFGVKSTSSAQNGRLDIVGRCIE